MSNLDTITLLNRLIVTTKNGEAALRAAASEVHHAELQESLEEYSRFFADAARELQATVEALGGKPKGTGTFDNTQVFLVPPGHFFMMGDNRDNSLDSRYWGFVPDQNIVGRAFFVWMNFGNLKRIGSFQ